MPVLLYNTLGWTRAAVVRLDVPISNVEAFDADNQELAVQVNEKVRAAWVRGEHPFARWRWLTCSPPELTSPWAVGVQAEGEGYDLFVRVTLPAVGFNTIYVRPTTQNAAAPLRARPVAAAAIESIANEFVRVSFDNATNLLTKIENLVRPAMHPSGGLCGQRLQWAAS